METITSSDTLTLLGRDLLIQSLKERMRHGEIVKFCYIKKDKSLRIAIGTLHSGTVQANVKGTGKHSQGVFSYIDLEKMEWRCFKIENFVGIIE